MNAVIDFIEHVRLRNRHAVRLTSILEDVKKQLEAIDDSHEARLTHVARINNIMSRLVVLTRRRIDIMDNAPLDVKALLEISTAEHSAYRELSESFDTIQQDQNDIAKIVINVCRSMIQMVSIMDKLYDPPTRRKK